MERSEGNERLRAGVASRPSAQDIVPVVERRRLELDGGIKAHHGLSHGLAGGIEIEAAPKAAALLKEIRHPSGRGIVKVGRMLLVIRIRHFDERESKRNAKRLWQSRPSRFRAGEA